jgi:hypothetical protein
MERRSKFPGSLSQCGEWTAEGLNGRKVKCDAIKRTPPTRVWFVFTSIKGLAGDCRPIKVDEQLEVVRRFCQASVGTRWLPPRTCWSALPPVPSRQSTARRELRPGFQYVMDWSLSSPTCSGLVNIRLVSRQPCSTVYSSVSETVDHRWTAAGRRRFRKKIIAKIVSDT